MAKTVKIAGVPGLDPTLPVVEREFGGKKYALCFTFGALAIAQRELRAIGSDCNILKSLELTNLDVTAFGPLLYAALITCKPDITLKEAESLITIKNLAYVYESLISAYGAAIAEPESGKPADPVKPE